MKNILKRINSFQTGGQFSRIYYSPINIESETSNPLSEDSSLYVDENYVQLNTSGQPSFYQPTFDLSEGERPPAQINPQLEIQESKSDSNPTPKTETNPMQGVKETSTKEVTWKQPETKPSIQTPTTKGTVSFKGKIDVGNMQPAIDKFSEAGINIRVTSGVRKSAKTSSGKESWHASGNAIDITPVAGETMDQLIQKIKNSTELLQWLSDNGYGILRETTDSALKRTGGTGYHLHIGKDTKAKEDLAALIQGKPPILAQLGAKFDKIKYAILNPKKNYEEHKENLREDTRARTKAKAKEEEETPAITEITSYKPQFELFTVDRNPAEPIGSGQTVEHEDGSKTIYPGNYVELPVEIPARTSTNFPDKKYNSNTELAADFIERYYNLLLEKGVKDPKQKAIILTAQDMLESGWGGSGLSKYNNFGGVKAGENPNYIEISTTEYKDGKPYQTTQKFRKFADIEEFIENKFNLYNNPDRYGSAIFDSYKNFINSVAKTYATAPDYAERWNKVVKYLRKLNSEWAI